MFGGSTRSKSTTIVNNKHCTNRDQLMNYKGSYPNPLSCNTACKSTGSLHYGKGNNGCFCAKNSISATSFKSQCKLGTHPKNPTITFHVSSQAAASTETAASTNTIITTQGSHTDKVNADAKGETYYFYCERFFSFQY